MPVTYLFRLLSLKKKLQFSGSGGFFVKEYFYITIIDFFLVIIFMNKIITKKEIYNKLSIIKSMDMLIIDDKKNK